MRTNILSIQTVQAFISIIFVFNYVLDRVECLFVKKLIINNKLIPN